MEWSLFRTAMILSDVGSCRRQRLKMTVGSAKRAPWCNQLAKEVIRTKKDAFKAWLKNKLSSDLQSRYSETRKAAAQAVKSSKNTLERSFVFD